jgi:lysophospholipase L1-like esterase
VKVLSKKAFARGVATCGVLLSAPSHADWVGGWGAAPFPATPILAPQDIRDYTNARVRQEMVVATSGTRVRVRMTNALGTRPLDVRSASVRIGWRTLPLRFAGRANAHLPPGANLTSDPVPIAVAAFQRIAVTVRYGADAAPAAHLLPVAVHYADGRVRYGRGPALASAIEVDRWRPGRVLVALGDSMTEGARAKPESFTGWPEQAAARLGKRGCAVGLVNAGIHGNRLLRDGAGPNALARFDRDVLSVAGLTDVLLFIGINDIGWGNARPGSDGPVTAADVIAGYRQVIDRAHTRGVTVTGATLPPFRDSVYFTAAGEAVRQAVNHWIRGERAFDAVVDFDGVLADPRDPKRLAGKLDSGDHLHPGDLGYAAMAAAVDIALLRLPSCREPALRSVK